MGDNRTLPLRRHESPGPKNVENWGEKGAARHHTWPDGDRRPLSTILRTAWVQIWGDVVHFPQVVTQHRKRVNKCEGKIKKTK